MPRPLLPRRALLRGAVAATLGVLTTWGARSGRAASAQLPVYVLLPTPDSETGRGCRCAACRRHAAQKLFATRLAAETHRAHPHCRCAVGERAVPAETWVALFGQPGQPRHLSRDRREDAVAAIVGIA